VVSHVLANPQQCVGENGRIDVVMGKKGFGVEVSRVAALLDVDPTVSN
jgi:hypothetical protein